MDKRQGLELATRHIISRLSRKEVGELVDMLADVVMIAGDVTLVEFVALLEREMLDPEQAGRPL